MGYNVNTTGTNFTIPADKLEQACQAMKDLNHSDSANKGGGSWGKRPDGTYGQTSKHFSWMHEHYDQQLHTAKEILETLGFQTETTEDGSLSITWYDDKIGDESQFLAVLAPFVPAGSYLNWEGEDGYRWQHYFDGLGMIERSGAVVYEPLPVPDVLQGVVLDTKTELSLTK